MAKNLCASAHQGHIDAAIAAGIPWQQIVTWLIQYGPQILVLVLQLIGPFLAKGGTVGKAVQWIEDALVAYETGQPLPPLPTLP
jgi:hypothetical protein